jgi:hypothetical protein
LDGLAPETGLDLACYTSIKGHGMVYKYFPKAGFSMPLLLPKDQKKDTELIGG